MVHQLSLVSSIPNSQHELTLQTLQLLTGMSPASFDLHYITLKPKYPFSPNLQLGKVNQVEQYRMKLISPSITTDEVPRKRRSIFELLDIPVLLNKDKIWTLQITDIPNAGKKVTCQQNIYETCIVDSGAHDDLIGYLQELGYQLESEYWAVGEKFYYNDIIIDISQIHLRDNDQLLDKSGNWFIKCYVNVEKSTDLDNINKSNKELEMFAKEINGLFELVIPDRLSMDSRINSIK